MFESDSSEPPSVDGAQLIVRALPPPSIAVVPDPAPTMARFTLSSTRFSAYVPDATLIVPWPRDFATAAPIVRQAAVDA